MGHERVGELPVDREALVSFAVTLWGMIEESKRRTKRFEDELKRVEEDISRMPKEAARDR